MATAKRVITAPHVILALAGLLVGVALGALWGVRDMRFSADLDSRGLQADATVVTVEEKGMSVSPGGYVSRIYVTVVFTDVAGTPVRATQQGRATTEVGDRLRVTYDPRDPTRVRWDGSGPTLLFDGLLALLMVAIFGPMLVISIIRAVRAAPSR
nr:DUF3592 domain-containing protein [Micromonospora sp. DSM 115978]